VVINAVHQVTNLLCAPGEEGYSEDVQNKLVNPCFEGTREQSVGMSHMKGKPAISKTFVSFSHSMPTILNSMTSNCIRVIKLNEFDYDVSVGMFKHLDHTGIPLSYILTGEKE
jgi:hypothetical protein